MIINKNCKFTENNELMRKKFYVVWKGNIPGIYDNWDTCKEQINGYTGALYKSFTTKEEADAAFKESAHKHIRPAVEKLKTVKTYGSKKPDLNSISVDAAWNTVTKVMEYRGVMTADGREIFRKGPFDDATNNIGEFLAIVHGISLLNNRGIDIPVYTDSLTAMKWVREKKTNTKLEPTERNSEIFDLIQRAIKWLKDHDYKNQVLKWDTNSWGEIPADFGRK